MIQLSEKKGSDTQRDTKVEWRTVLPEEAGQRLDNFLQRVRGGVPKTRIYRAIRKGEVRVNKGRVKPDTRLEAGVSIRIPPLRVPEKAEAAGAAGWRARLRDAVVREESTLLVINKPPGLAVHGGSGISVGLIETLRAMYDTDRYLELVHRLDRDTSGLLLVARRASTLRSLHGLLRSNGVDKRYLCLVSGRWPAHLKRVDAPLEKFALPSGERRVKVAAAGRQSLTTFRVVTRWSGATLVEAKPVTGRTHQIRVHCQHAGFPILGDAKYSDEAAIRLAAKIGLKRLFLHAASLNFRLEEQNYSLEAPLPKELQRLIESLV
ncbi:RluA family pseudouridine synthase [Luminiphilus sp. nBUS_07]|uniref:RluA family pseudouridine synthase n=1 Tax=Luminiphilus sp. nBUS_07 TaxID=3395314 RepID=UPI003EBAAADC